MQMEGSQTHLAEMLVLQIWDAARQSAILKQVPPMILMQVVWVQL